jgi:hypothetical protein
VWRGANIASRPEKGAAHLATDHAMTRAGTMTHEPRSKAQARELNAAINLMPSACTTGSVQEPACAGSQPLSPPPIIQGIHQAASQTRNCSRCGQLVTWMRMRDVVKSRTPLLIRPPACPPKNQNASAMVNTVVGGTTVAAPGDRFRGKPPSLRTWFGVSD